MKFLTRLLSSNNHQPPPSQVNPTQELVDLVAALTVTDEGPMLGNQPSKLFTSREQFQQGRAAHNPTEFNPDGVTIAAATSSISALLTAPRPTPRPRQNWRKDRDTKLAASVLGKIREAEVRLVVPLDYQEENPEAVAQMRKNLDVASQILKACTGSLDLIKKDIPEKSDALDALKVLNMRIAFIGASLPEVTTPLVYDACEFLLVVYIYHHSYCAQPISTIIQWINWILSPKC